MPRCLGLVYDIVHIVLTLFGVTGVVTKAAVAHPHQAGKDIGVLALKRTMMIL